MGLSRVDDFGVRPNSPRMRETQFVVSETVTDQA
jgi:hypothetical protein